MRSQSGQFLAGDLKAKMALYARHGVPELWIIDVQHQRLRVFRRPAGEAYENVSTSDDPGIVPVTALPGVAVDLSSLFR